MTACPCGNPRTYESCCGRWHEGTSHLQAPDAEHLMRSRYTAFVLELHDYLLDTWHPSTRPSSIGFDPNTHWLGLAIKRVDNLDAEHAIVEFVARHKSGGRASRMHESSRFLRDDGRWYYVDGDHP